MRTLVRRVSLLLVRSGPGRWVLSIALLLIGALAFIAGIAPPKGQTQTATLSALIGGVVVFALGIAMLVATIRLGRMRKRVIAARKVAAEQAAAGVARAEELKQSGLLLPIPALPAPRADITQDDMARVEGYAQRMAALPWGDHIATLPDDVRAVFDRTVARVQTVTGDWTELGEPIDTFVGLPRPLCYVGAAEVMYRLSYLRARTYASNGLRQGLRFIARAQYTEPRQPDALVIRTKLLAGGATKTWLELADATLALLREVAPDHPRLPEAEMAIHRQRREYAEALACADCMIANPPSPEEAYIAQSRRADILLDMQRYDEAVASYDALLAQTPRDPWKWHNKSVALMNLGRFDEALDSNARALSIMNFGMAHTIRERILARQAEAAAGNTSNTSQA